MQKKQGEDGSYIERDEADKTVVKEEKHTIRTQGGAQDTQEQKDKMAQKVEWWRD